jgi:bacteriocin-like protein
MKKKTKNLKKVSKKELKKIKGGYKAARDAYVAQAKTEEESLGEKVANLVK